LREGWIFSLHANMSSLVSLRNLISTSIPYLRPEYLCDGYQRCSSKDKNDCQRDTTYRVVLILRMKSHNSTFAFVQASIEKEMPSAGTESLSRDEDSGYCFHVFCRNWSTGLFGRETVISCTLSPHGLPT
jgi:hypothetical protein